MGYNETVHQLFTDFKKTSGSVMKEVLYNILIECCMSMQLVRLLKMCLKETCSKVRISKILSDTFHMQNVLKQGDALAPFLSNFALEYGIRKAHENQVVLKLKGTHQLPVYADVVIYCSMK
jgi:hypothetical protein